MNIKQIQSDLFVYDILIERNAQYGGPPGPRGNFYVGPTSPRREASVLNLPDLCPAFFCLNQPNNKGRTQSYSHYPCRSYLVHPSSEARHLYYETHDR
jgi:hypothetical protein